MKKVLTFVVIAMLGVFAAQASTYKLNDAAVDAMFASAVQVDLMSLESAADFAHTNHSFVSADKDPLIAFLLSWFLGPLGIHRAYLGTSTGTIIGYILTLGGCGIVATVDWIVLLVGLINDDISKYIDNPKFFMW